MRVLEPGRLGGVQGLGVRVVEDTPYVGFYNKRLAASWPI